MPASISVKADVEDVRKMLNDVRRRALPYAVATALTRTAKDCESAVKGEMARVFDRPTPFTLNSTYIKPATAVTQRAWVGIKDSAFKGNAPIKWLGPQIYGGPRDMKRSEDLLRSKGILPAGMFIVPAAGAKLDAYGNISRGMMQQVLSAVGAARDPYQNSTPNSRKRNRRQGEYFVINTPSHLAMGIYQRMGRGAVRPIVMFVRQPMYHKRLRFFEVVEETARVSWPAEFQRALDSVMARFA